MPELPEVETTKNGIKDAILGLKVSKVIIRQHQLRWKIPTDLPETIKNHKLTEIERRAKYLLLHFDNGCLILHLGMSGKLRILNGDDNEPKKHDHVDIIFENKVTMRYNDPRRFGCILWSEEDPSEHRLIKNLGVEPLNSEFNGKFLFNVCQKRNINIKKLIMDAKIVVGVGNIYASEALFMSKVHPQFPAKQLDLATCQSLCKNIKQVLRKSIKAGGTTLKDFSKADGKPGYFSQQLLVYGREGEYCNSCATDIEKIVIGGRSSFYCPKCQEL